jgi:hypothetical protein
MCHVSTGKITGRQSKATLSTGPNNKYLNSMSHKTWNFRYKRAKDGGIRREHTRLRRPDREHVRPRRAPLMRMWHGGTLATQESTTIACQTLSSSPAASAGRLEEVIPYRKACRGPLLLPPLAHNSRQGTGLGRVGWHDRTWDCFQFLGYSSSNNNVI